MESAMNETALTYPEACLLEVKEERQQRRQSKQG